MLAQTLNLYAGGTCIEDVANLQHSEAVRRILGACRIPDPTTAGDFLRRFHEKDYQLPGLRRAVDEVQVAVWRRLRRGRGKRGEAWSIVDRAQFNTPMLVDAVTGAVVSTAGQVAGGVPAATADGSTVDLTAF